VCVCACACVCACVRVCVRVCVRAHLLEGRHILEVFSSGDTGA
jgi:hypothetical protein